MALHGDNEGGAGTDSGATVNPIAKLTQDLESAFKQAGDEMARQVAASVVAIVAGVTHGQSLPGFQGWSIQDCPPQLLSVIPEHALEFGSFIMIRSEQLVGTKLFEGEPIWEVGLASGHQLLVLA